MASQTRVALIGGSDTVRNARRQSIEQEKDFIVVYDNDGFELTQSDFLQITYDVAVIDQRLTNSSAYEFVAGVQAVARVTDLVLGRILISSAYSDKQLRLSAIESGALDAVFVSDGLERFIELLRAAVDPDADFAIRELLDLVEFSAVEAGKYAFAEKVLDLLDEKEAAIMRNFCELKTDSQISQIVKVPKLKVRNTLTKAQNLLMLNTRSQLILLLRRLGAL